MLANWKTTSAGLAAICTAAAHVFTSGSLSAADLSAIFAGVMGILAKDAS